MKLRHDGYPNYFELSQASGSRKERNNIQPDRIPKVMLSRRPEIHEGPPMKFQTQNMCNNDRSNNNNNKRVAIETIT